MENLDGRVGVVTGAASGIGLEIARALAAEGARVVLADVERGALEAAAATFTTPVTHRVCDVTKGADVQALADHAFGEFGAVHVVCNNAGVSAAGRTWEQTEKDWEWVLGVNLWGVVHGIRAFVPRMLESGEPGHVVNTSSMSGMVPGPSVGAYGASKAGVIALSESLHQDFIDTGAALHAHVLLPSFTRTRIIEGERNRPPELGGKAASDAPVQTEADRERTKAMLATGQDPADTAAAVLDAIHHDRFWIIPVPSAVERVKVRMESIIGLKNPTIMTPPPVNAPKDS